MYIQQHHDIQQTQNADILQDEQPGLFKKSMMP